MNGYDYDIEAEIQCKLCQRSETVIIPFGRKESYYNSRNREYGTVGTEIIGCYCLSDVILKRWSNRKGEFVPMPQKKAKMTNYSIMCSRCGEAFTIAANNPDHITCKDIGCKCEATPVIVFKQIYNYNKFVKINRNDPNLRR